MKGEFKVPLIIAAILVVGRVLLERAGAPETINNLLSVVVFYVLVVPLYFAFRIAKTGVPHQYSTLLRSTALFTALARAMVIQTYWLAYAYQWPQARFSTAAGGNVGPGITPLWGYVLIPIGAALLWILVSLIVGGGLGSILIAVKRKSSRKVQETPVTH